MNQGEFLKSLARAIKLYESYTSRWNEYEHFDIKSLSKIEPILVKLFERLNNTYPFFHPLYAGQMLKPPHPIAIISYFSAMLFNSNNHALDGGPATSLMEMEVVKQIANMIGFKNYLGHLTSGGTMANLEGLWIAKQINPKSDFAICENAHYTHTRLANVLDFKFHLIKMDKSGKIDLQHLEQILKKKKIVTVVATLGTTGLGAIDDLHKLVHLKNKYGFRLHVDAAYGGFFKILSNLKSNLINSLPFDALQNCDSVVIDPHKHGLQPYGCGSIIFKDPKVGKYYKHDSPYTYFTSRELHLGEVSLECSRAGASAAALWATLRLFPLNSKKGLYKYLIESRKAALKFESMLSKSENFRLLVSPELDIVNYFPLAQSTSKISSLGNKLFDTLMKRKIKPVYLSLYRMNSDFFCKINSDIKKDSHETVILRSVLMKPEHKIYVSNIIEELEKTYHSLISK